MAKQTPGTLIATLRNSDTPTTLLREILGTPDGPALLLEAVDTLGSMTQLADHIGVAHSTLGKLLRAFGVDYSDTGRAFSPSLDPDHYDLQYWRKKALRLEKTNSQLEDLYANIGAVFTELIGDHPPETPVEPYRYTEQAGLADEELSLIFISDTHYGELVLPQHTSGLSEFNKDIFIQRRDRYMETLDKLVNGHLRKVYPLKKAYVVYLGDNLSGEDIFPKQLARLDRTLMYQMTEGAVYLSQLLRYICGMYEEVYAFFVPGNHGDQKATTLNSDVILSLFMALLLQNQPNLNVVLSDSELCGVYLNQKLGLLPWPEEAKKKTWNFLFTHGHGTTSWGGIPYYGLDRMVQRLQNSTGLIWDAVFAGHHHVSASTDNWKLIGSWVGGTDYSMHKMQAASRPTQLLQGFHPKVGLTWSFPIYLDDAPSLTQHTQTTPGMYTPHNSLLDILNQSR